MTLPRIANICTILTAAFLFYIGLNFLIDPYAAVSGFGLPESSWPDSAANAIMNVKGGRDVGLGTVILVLLFARQRKALAWAVLAMVVMPVIDATVVLSYGGSLVAALGIHISAAVFVAISGTLQLWAAKREAN